MAAKPMTTRIWKMAEPTTVPRPVAGLAPVRKRAKRVVLSSGALVPAAMKVAPETLGGSLRVSEILSRDLIKISSTILARK